MQNPIKTAALFVIGVLSLGAVTVMQPRESRSVTTPDNAPMLQPVRVAPVEKIETHVIRRGETLSGVLSRLSVVGQDLADALLVMREHQDPHAWAPAISR